MSRYNKFFENQQTAENRIIDLRIDKFWKAL